MGYTLNCIVFGEKIAFQVEINEAQSVDKLKREIKKQEAPEFNNFAHANLTLYKLNVAESNKDYRKI